MKSTLIFFAVVVIGERLFEALTYRKKKGEIYAAWTTAAMFAAHIFCFAGALLEWRIASNEIHLGSVCAGFLLFSAGWILRKKTIRSLGRYWSLSVEIRSDHPLITDGPFALCRHPNYLAILLEVTGYGCVFSAWKALALTWMIYGPVLWFRVHAEEREMKRHFGQIYEAYCRRTPAIMPRLR
ncbi:MAG: isoprenylcysteine carboxylmethyltransferase family protein [Candidatus Omnitrophica bacterium]|nr:isoprenylcysteine carboxylmethyltransferase family protein [Candidatus Omnitrophota bacterium]